MKVLMVSHAGVIDANRVRLYTMLERYPDLEMALLAPARWYERDLRREYLLGEASGRLRLFPGVLANSGSINLHWYRSGMREAFDNFAPDILHLDEEPYSLAAAQAVHIARPRSLKTIIFSFQNILKRYPWPFSAIEKYVMESADYAVTGNGEAVEILRAKGYSGLAQVIPPGVDIKAYTDQGRTDTSIKEGHPVIGYMGRFVPGKGLRSLLKALVETNEDVHLWLIGSGPQEEELRHLAAELGVERRIRFFGLLPHREVPRYMKLLDAFVLPSLSMPGWKEQFGRVLVEAMACGVVPVGSSSGEIPNVIGDAGLVFDEGDAHHLAAQINHLMADTRLREELSRRGQRRAKEIYSWENISRQTYNVYRQLWEEMRI